jgi:hypothetical protein
MPKVFEEIFDGHRLVFEEIASFEGELHQGHQADGLYFKCCDFRFRVKDNQFMDGLENGLFDPFSSPGSYTMAFLGPKYGHPDGKEYTLYWVEKMLSLHHTNRIYLTAHGKHTGKCGAYASTLSLAGKSDEEMYKLQLKDALEVQQVLKQRFPETEIHFIYVEYDEQARKFSYRRLRTIEPLAMAA